METEYSREDDVMLRKSLLLIVVAALACAAVPAEAQSRAKARKKDQAKTLQVGDEVVTHLIGDEAKRFPKISAAGVITPDYLTVPVYRRISASRSDPDFYFDSQTTERFNEAAMNGDKVGMDRLVGEGRAVRVPPGTRLIVLQRSPTVVNSSTGLPTVPGGECMARIADGENKDKLISIPVRNLREPPPSTPDQKP
jgi:hypothetical protein